MEFITLGYEVTQFLNIVNSGKDDLEMTTDDNFIADVETYMSYKIAHFLSFYWFPVLVPIGLVGNTLSFLVMIKPNNRRMSTCIYMAAISINDNILMCVCYHNWLVAALKIHVWNHAECKIAVFLGLYALQNSTFQIVAMTVDKHIAIKRPHRAATYSTPRRAKILALVMFICTLIFNIPHLFLSRIIGDQCVAYGIGVLITKVYSWLSFILNAVIPFTLLIHMNYIIVKTVRNRRKIFRANETTTGAARNQGIDTRHKTMKSAETQLTIMLLLVTTLFLILLCPSYIRFIYLSFAKQDTPFKYASSMFIYQISFKLYSTNSDINFLLYCISGQKFRNNLKEILCSCERRKNSRSNSSITVVSTF